MNIYRIKITMPDGSKGTYTINYVFYYSIFAILRVDFLFKCYHCLLPM